MKEPFIMQEAGDCKRELANSAKVSQVEVIEQPGHGKALSHPYVVRVNGKMLLDRQFNIRRFSSSIKASTAGAREADNLCGSLVNAHNS